MQEQNNLQSKLIKIYNFISEEIYYCKEDFILESKEYNSAVLLGILTSILDSNILYVGEYGLGKTMLSETLASLILSIPKDIVESSSIKGNPELSYEQIIGRPDLGKLNAGIEQVIWSDFVLSKPKIVDEINRIPEHKQNILLTGMQSNMWKYLNGFIKTKKGPWLATKNYKDSGNNNIVPPLLDRFDICLESKSPGINNIRLMRFNKSESLSYEDITEAYITIMKTENLTFEDYSKGMFYVSEEFRKRIFADYNLELINEEDINNAKKQIYAIDFSNDANYFMDALIAEVGSCQLYGQKRNHDECPEECHYSNYACYKIKNGISNRTINSIHNYSKALAWVSNEKEVTKEHVEKIFPYAIWHKTNFKEAFLETIDMKQREDPLSLHASNIILSEIIKRQSKIKSAQIQFANNILSDNYSGAGEIASKIDHPVFKEYLK